MNFRTLNNFLAVKIREEKKVNGIIIPETVKKDKPTVGEVVELPVHIHDNNGNIFSPEFKVGDKVVFSKFAGKEVSSDEESKTYIMKYGDVMAVIYDEGNDVK